MGNDNSNRMKEGVTMILQITEGSIRVVLTIAIVIIIWWIVIRSRAKNNADNSLTILKQRMEKGEISKEEYEQARKMQQKDKV